MPTSIVWLNCGGSDRMCEFHKDYALEVRYLGSRGIHLPTQNKINIQNSVFDGPGGFLPTFFSTPSQSTIDSLATSLADIENRPNILPQYLAAGFTSPITAFLANGNSTYHSALDRTQRFVVSTLYDLPFSRVVKITLHDRFSAGSVWLQHWLLNPVRRQRC